MQGPGGAFILVSLQLLIGTFGFMWVALICWKSISRGYYRSTTWVLLPLIGLIALVLPGHLRTLGFITAGLMAAFLAAVYSQRPALEWISGAAAAGSGLLLVIISGFEVCRTSCWIGAWHAIAGVLLMGAVTHGMVLGHWYLNQARLPIEPLRQQTLAMFAAMGISAILGIATRGALLAGVVPAGIFAFASSGYWWSWLLLMAGTAGLGAMIWATVRQRSTQSATGLLYIAIVTALGAQFLLNLLVST